jgi:hypothetical protein
MFALVIVGLGGMTAGVKIVRRCRHFPGEVRIAEVSDIDVSAHRQVPDSDNWAYCPASDT